jgi:hypothetical protein
MLLSLKYPKKILGSRHRLTGNRGCRWTGALTRRSTTVREQTDECYSGASPRLVRVHPLETARSPRCFVAGVWSRPNVGADAGRALRIIPRASLSRPCQPAGLEKGFTLRGAPSGLLGDHGPSLRADNSGLTAHGPPAETHECTAFGCNLQTGALPPSYGPMLTRA